jgi:glycosyltransferase involved in cell wall biosynthesis
MNQSLVSSPLISLCMIVKNESNNLPRCLASAKPYVDEIIVIDTGSVDETLKIAAEYGAKLSYFEWCDDFAAARNYAISQASGDWILMLDADEELLINSQNFLNKLNNSSEIIAYTLTYREVYDQQEKTPITRISLFRNLPELRYVSRFHEQLKYQNQQIDSNQVSHTEALIILHYGHSKELVQQKNISRNIPILERMQQEEGLSMTLLYTLTIMYRKNQQLDKAKECYAEARERLAQNLVSGQPPEEFSRVPCLIYDLGMQAFAEKDYENARLYCKRGLEWYGNYPPLNYLAGVILSALKFPIAAAVYFEKCIQLGQESNFYKHESFDLVFITTYPAYNLGLLYIDMEQPQKALAAFELVLSFDQNFADAQEKAHLIRQYMETQV